MWQYNYNLEQELYHHGIKGQKWGIRHYQYADGSLTPAGYRHYGYGKNKKVSKKYEKIENKVKDKLYKVTGNQYKDDFIEKGTNFSRIQTSKDFEKFAFYATYEQDDVDKYLGLFGKNLRQRAEVDAKKAEKQANKTNDDDDILAASKAREYSDNLKVYQLHLENTKKLKIPSDENASDITFNLLKNKQFKSDLVESINDSKSKMLRPQQQILFKQANNALKKDLDSMTYPDKKAIYKAFNLSLVYHNDAEIRAQSIFYTEMSKKGYNAILDYNDKSYSSYHAKKPTIVFDVESVKLSAISETNPKVVDQLYSKYNAERVKKEAVQQTLGIIEKMGTKTVSECYGYVNDKVKKYLNN